MNDTDRPLLKRLLDPATPEDERKRLIAERESLMEPAEREAFRRTLERASAPKREPKQD